MRPEPERPIALVGLMGAGKTEVARLLVERLGAPIGDLVALLEAEEGRSIRELFAHEGEPYFRRRERELLERVLAAGVRVLACGGGVVLDPRARRLLKERCRVVWLEVSPEVAASRVAATAATAATRPLLEGAPVAERLAALLSERTPLYAEVAGVRVATDGRSVAEVADRVGAALAVPR